MLVTDIKLSQKKAKATLRDAQVFGHWELARKLKQAVSDYNDMLRRGINYKVNF